MKRGVVPRGRHNKRREAEAAELVASKAPKPSSSASVNDALTTTSSPLHFWNGASLCCIVLLSFCNRSTNNSQTNHKFHTNESQSNQQCLDLDNGAHMYALYVGAHGFEVNVNAFQT